MIKFYDTNAILKLQDKIFEEKFVISSVTLRELENIKTNRNKDENVKFNARNIVRLLNKNCDKYDVIVFDSKVLDTVNTFGIPDNPDNEICACARYYKATTGEDVLFATDDLCCRIIARDIFGLHVCAVGDDNTEEYKGFVEKSLSEEEMAYFYENLNENSYNLLTNQYLILKDSSGEIVDKFKWDGATHQPVKLPTIKSNIFGAVKPYNGDVYQQLALNSFDTNQLTMIKGVAGTGKSYLAVGYLLYLLDKRKIDKIIVFCNTVATANSAKLGYYPGTKDEKLLDSSIGNMLSAKLGNVYGLEQMIDEGKIVLLPLSDIRGYDTGRMNAGVYITEAQNMDISLMKLALQRIGQDCICIVDGDYNAQVDLSQYAGNNNGMRRMSEVFRGQNFYGEVELQNIYRSKIAEIAENM